MLLILLLVVSTAGVCEMCDLTMPVHSAQSGGEKQPAGPGAAVSEPDGQGGGEHHQQQQQHYTQDHQGQGFPFMGTGQTVLYISCCSPSSILFLVMRMSDNLYCAPKNRSYI